MGNLFIGKLTTSMLITAIIYTLLIVALITKFIFLLPNIVLIKVLGSIIVVFVFIILFKNIFIKIDGVTGDILGCGIELSELTFNLHIFVNFYVFKVKSGDNMIRLILIRHALTNDNKKEDYQAI